MISALTGHREKDIVLVRLLFRSIVVDRDAAGGNVSTLLGPWDVPKNVSGALM